MTSFIYQGMNRIELQAEIVFDVFVNGEHQRTFSNDIQINEFLKRIWEKEKLAEVLVKPVIREYVGL